MLKEFGIRASNAIPKKSCGERSTNRTSEPLARRSISLAPGTQFRRTESRTKKVVSVQGRHLAREESQGRTGRLHQGRTAERTRQPRIQERLRRTEPDEYSSQAAVRRYRMFISITADMLNENMKFDEILKIHATDVQNKTLRNAVKSISRDLRQGQDGMSVFQKYSDVFGKFTAYMLGLASKSGNMAEIYRSTADYLNRQADFQKNLRQALVMPIVTFLAILGAIGVLRRQAVPGNHRDVHPVLDRPPPHDGGDHAASATSCKTTGGG